MVNLSVALANAYITPLPPSPDDLRSAANAEPTPAPQQAPPPTKKGAKADQQLAATSGGPSGASSTTVKTEDLKSAVEVNHLIEQILIIFFCNKRYVNMQ